MSTFGMLTARAARVKKKFGSRERFKLTVKKEV